ncbi:MAG: type II toxin-antitoxin system RelE/ParE family toxin [Gemmatimonas sp.]|nr:type II toxin-antitoxin system RelE/ParE family toxin [Gemmatimonas sp.]
MGQESKRYRKPLKFVPGVEKAVRELPADVQDVFGKALMDAQYGDQVSGARPFGEGVPRDVLKLVEDDDGETYRAAFVVAFAGVVYLLDVFQKKSKSGRATPQSDLDRVTARYHAAVQDYETSKATYLAATEVAKDVAIAKATRATVRSVPMQKRGAKD